jgi:hypothetical protein
MLPSTPTGGAYRNMSLLYYQTNPDTLQRRVICALTPRAMWTRFNGLDYAVPSRTVLVTVQQGVITGCNWAPSTCTGNPAAKELDAICALPCSNNGCVDFKITVCDFNLAIYWLDRNRWKWQCSIEFCPRFVSYKKCLLKLHKI